MMDEAEQYGTLPWIFYVPGVAKIESCNTSSLPTSKPISYLFDPTLDTNSEDSFWNDLVSLNFGDNAVFTADLSLKKLPLLSFPTATHSLSL